MDGSPPTKDPFKIGRRTRTPALVPVSNSTDRLKLIAVHAPTMERVPATGTVERGLANGADEGEDLLAGEGRFALDLAVDPEPPVGRINLRDRKVSAATLSLRRGGERWPPCECTGVGSSRLKPSEEP